MDISVFFFILDSLLPEIDLKLWMASVEERLCDFFIRWLGKLIFWLYLACFSALKFIFMFIFETIRFSLTSVLLLKFFSARSDDLALLFLYLSQFLLDWPAWSLSAQPSRFCGRGNSFSKWVLYPSLPYQTWWGRQVSIFSLFIWLMVLDDFSLIICFILNFSESHVGLCYKIRACSLEEWGVWNFYKLTLMTCALHWRFSSLLTFIWFTNLYYC